MQSTIMGREMTEKNPRFDALKSMTEKLLNDVPILPSTHYKTLLLRLQREDFFRYEDYIVELFDKYVGYGME